MTDLLWLDLRTEYKLYWEELLEQKFGFADMADLAWQDAERMMGYKKEKSLYIYFDKKMVAFYSQKDSIKEAEVGYDFYAVQSNIDGVIEIKRRACEESALFLEDLKGRDIKSLSADELRILIVRLMDVYFQGLSAHYLTQPQFFEKFEESDGSMHIERLAALANARFHYSKLAWVRPLQSYESLYAAYSTKTTLTPDQAKSLTREELESARAVSAEELQNRIEKYVIISDFHRLRSVFGPPVDAYIQAYHRYIKSYEKRTGEGVAHGVIGNRGVAIGEAFVIKNEEFDPLNMPRGMKKGMILIVQNAWPDLQPYYEQASAIVTNEGGITSHGVVVARELGIPCVVGTRIATKVFTTGDIVEVDANRGVVTIIKHE